jgi:hypothetical protein
MCRALLARDATWRDAPTMPDVLRGLVVVAEYGSKFEADAAAALLAGGGIEATVTNDPALTSTHYGITDRTVQLAVRSADAAEAVALLANGGPLVDELDQPFVPSPTGRRRRRRAKAVVLFGLFVWLGGPALILLAIKIGELFGQ